MGGVEHSAECIAQELVDDGPAAEAQQFVGHGEVALYVAPREIDAHRGGLADAMIHEALPEAEDVVAAQGEDGCEQFVLVDDALVEAQADAVDE